MNNLPFGRSPSSSGPAPAPTRNSLPVSSPQGPNLETSQPGGIRLIINPPTPRGATNTPFKLNGGG